MLLVKYIITTGGFLDHSAAHNEAKFKISSRMMI